MEVCSVQTVVSEKQANRKQINEKISKKMYNIYINVERKSEINRSSKNSFASERKFNYCH